MLAGGGLGLLGLFTLFELHVLQTPPPSLRASPSLWITIVVILAAIYVAMQATMILVMRRRKSGTISMFEDAPVAVAWIDPDTGKIIHCNEAAARLFGRPASSLVGKPFTVFHPKDKEREYLERFASLSKDRNAHVLEMDLRHSQGHMIPVRLAASHVQLGDRYAIQAIFMDLGEQKELETRLLQSEKEFRLVFENSKDPIFWADANTGIIINCNKAAEALVEKTRDEIIGAHQGSLHPPGKADEYAAMFQKHIRDNGAIDDKAEIQTSNGRIIPVHISGSLTETGDKIILQGIFRDITELEQLRALRQVVASSPK